MHEEGKQPQNDTKIFGLTPVFLISSIAIVIFVIGSLVFREGATSLFGATRKWLTTNFDWWFMDIVNLLVLFCLFLIVSPLGKVRLGGQDAVPEYSNLTWFAMLFAAGIGIGLLFFGVLEPVQHFMSPFPSAVKRKPIQPSVSRRRHFTGVYTAGRSTESSDLPWHSSPTTEVYRSRSDPHSIRSLVNGYMVGRVMSSIHSLSSPVCLVSLLRLVSAHNR